MNVNTHRSTWAVGLYRWAQREWDHEFRHNFTRLAELNSHFASVILRVMKTVPVGERQQMAKALVKRFHPEAVQFLAEELTPLEDALLRNWDAERRRLIQEAPELQLKSAVRKPRLARVIRGRLDVLGEAEFFGGQSTWVYTQRVAEWTIRTFVDLGGKHQKVKYHHDVATPDKAVVARFVSLLSWLGLSSETALNVVDEQQAASAATSIRELCRHFLEAIPEILDMGSDSTP